MIKHTRILAATAASVMVGLLAAPVALADPTPPPVPGHGYSPTPIPGYSCSDAWDFQRCIATGGKDMGAPPPYLIHTASPAWTGGGGR
ncbi:Uncharacterised protein [Mycobacteroides abscessus subsp. abscessus]|uniref:hypothetical protein n=1 Tax=Mycobacteroides abscessus TaxID=36809 RepID=UPI0009D28DB1|nr:hypothetical protein [Mycobacteroides abscessus]SLH96918.1 Uncharacterised protein [Mycobacteroides abscessus subsp. abscessus]